MKQDLHALLGDLVIANRILAHEGVLDDFGRVAVRHPERPDRFFVSRLPEIVTRDDLLEFMLNGVPVDPKGLRLISRACCTRASSPRDRTCRQPCTITARPCCPTP